MKFVADRMTASSELVAAGFEGGNKGPQSLR